MRYSLNASIPWKLPIVLKCPNTVVFVFVALVVVDVVVNRAKRRLEESSATLAGCSEETTLKWSSDCFAHVGPRKHVRQPLARAKQGRQSCLQQGWEYEHASRHLTSGWRATERTVEQGHETSWQDVSCREGNLWAKEARAKLLARARQVRRSCLRQSWGHEHASQHLPDHHSNVRHCRLLRRRQFVDRAAGDHF